MYDVSKLLKEPNPFLRAKLHGGRQSGLYGLRKFGQGVHVSAADISIWDYDADYKDHILSAASGLWASSSNEANDTELVIELEYLDASWNWQVTTVTLDDTDARTFVKIQKDGEDISALRVFRAKVTGSTLNTGNIYISGDNTDAGGDGIPDTVTDIIAMITAAKGQTKMAVYTIPNGYCGYMQDWYGRASRGNTSYGVDLELLVRENGGAWISKDEMPLVSVGASELVNPMSWERFPAKTDILVQSVDVSSGDRVVSAGFNMLLVKESYP